MCYPQEIKLKKVNNMVIKNLILFVGKRHETNNFSNMWWLVYFLSMENNYFFSFILFKGPTYKSVTLGMLSRH